MTLMKRLKLFIILICVLLLYAFYYIGIPAILNTKKFNDVIQNIVQKESGLNVEIISPKFKMG